MASDSDFMPAKSVKKFYPDGSSKVYRGHSVIALLPTESPLRSTLNEIHNALSTHYLRPSLFPDEALLPPTSWHMTVFIGVRDLERAPAVMPHDYYAEDIKATSGLDGPYEDWLNYTRSQLLSQGGLPTDAAPPYELIVSRAVDEIEYQINIPLELSRNSRGNLLYARDELSEQTGLRFPNHDSPRFHITLAYMVRAPDFEEAATLKELVDSYLAYAPRTVVFPFVGLYSFEDMQNFNVEVDLSEPRDEECEGDNDEEDEECEGDNDEEDEECEGAYDKEDEEWDDENALRRG
ncbi:RNA ligase/cyclic nucleotide phosphodiesterase [Aspergillus undulatus]|uniref:RNA ligase/cyclic nucleotide phosphodiesterase n=1 Tax=Aspergillus undulatus TaxID=1810928 RepID=UPI003CCE03AD